MDVFLYNAQTGQVEINKPELLLIKEFAALFDTTRNKCKQDPNGTQHLRAFREFTYIYLMLDWKSPYSEESEQDRHIDVLADSKLTQEEFDDPKFRVACRKYRELQETSLTVKLYNSAKNTISRFIDYFDSVDPQERDPLTGRPIYKVKDIMSEIGNLSEMLDEFKNLELQVKKEQQGGKESVMGDSELGIFD